MKVIEKEYLEHDDIYVINKIISFLDKNKDLSEKEFYEILSIFYEFQFNYNDYKKYIKLQTGLDFNKILTLKTDVVNTYIHSEGSGRDFSWWTTKERLNVTVAVCGDLESEHKIFKFDELKKLINEKKIYPVDYYYSECSDRTKENKVDNDIDYLLCGNEFIDFCFTSFNNKSNIINLFNVIRKYIICNKIDLEYYLNFKNSNFYYEDRDENREKLLLLDKIIDLYNKLVSNFNGELKLINKDTKKFVCDYLINLQNLPDNKWYDEISIEQIIKVLNSIADDKDVEYCKIIENLAIKLNDSDLCYCIAYDVEWSDPDKLINVAIDNKDIGICYDSIVSEVYEIFSDENIYRILELISNFGSLEQNYDVSCKLAPNFDVKKNELTIINSKNLLYNYLYAKDVEGADVKKHGEVIINSGDAKYNYLFAVDVEGADINRHLEVIKKQKNDKYRLLLEGYLNSLNKEKSKKPFSRKRNK